MESWEKTIYISWGIIFCHTAGTGMVMPFLPLYINVYQLLVLRILHGFCAGMIPAFIALVSYSLPKHKIGQGIGTMQSAQFSGHIIGPFIGGVLADFMGYRQVLWVITFLTVLSGVATVFFIHEPKRDPAKPRSTVMNNIKLVLTSSDLKTVAIVMFAIQFALHLVQPILPLFIVSLHGKGNSATMVGLVFAITGFSTLLFAPYWGKVGDKKGHKKILSRSLLFAGISFFPQALVLTAYQLLPLRAIMGFFVAGTMPTTQTMIVKNTKDSQRGGVLGITHSVQSCGGALGPLVGGAFGALLGYRFTIILTSLSLIAIWYSFRRLINKT